MSPPTHLLFGNPSARSGKAQESIDAALLALGARGIDVGFIPTEPEGRTINLVRDAVLEKQPRVVITLGGDGTFHEVATGLMLVEEPPMLGMIPMGTANDQGRSFGIRPGRRGVEENIGIIAEGHVTRLDVGKVSALGIEGEADRKDESFLFDNIGWGMQPEILATRNQDRQIVGDIPILRDLYRDQAVYAGAALDRFVASFLEPTKFDATVTIDGEKHELTKLTDLAINGTAVYAGEWVFDRESEPDDGVFELIPVRGRRDWAKRTLSNLRFLPLDDELEFLGVTTTPVLRGSKFEVQLHRDQPLRSQIDGEEWIAGSRFTVEVLKNRLPLITRAGWLAPWKR